MAKCLSVANSDGTQRFGGEVDGAKRGNRKDIIDSLIFIGILRTTYITAHKLMIVSSQSFLVFTLLVQNSKIIP